MKQVVTSKPGQSKASRRRVELGVKVLMLAVLDDALATYRRGVASPQPSRRTEALRVEAWVESNNVNGAFAFLNVCRVVGASPAYVRACMAAWRRRALHEDERIN